MTEALCRSCGHVTTDPMIGNCERCGSRYLQLTQSAGERRCTTCGKQTDSYLHGSLIDAGDITVCARCVDRLAEACS